jgi:hypothetical protein
MPALTQFVNAVTSDGGTVALGAGGIGELVDCIRMTERAPLLVPEYPGDCPWRAASVASVCGAPPVGGEAWQLQQCAARRS